MIGIEYQFDGGTPCDIQQVDPGTYRVAPYASQSGSQWFYVCFRIEGLSADQPLTVLLDWPRRWTAADLPAGSDQETIGRLTTHDLFCDVLDRTVYRSSDMHQWQRVSDVDKVEERLVRIELVGDGEPICLATQLPYLWSDYLSLAQWVKQQGSDLVQQIGSSRAGMPLYAMVLPALDAPADRPTVYLQGYQHASEFSGPRVLDAMLRFLLAEPEGHALREQVNFEIVPVVDVDGLRYGGFERICRPMLPTLRNENPNRDWLTGHWPEVAAIKRFVESRFDNGVDYLLGLDLHNGWYKTNTSAACYTRLTPEDALDPEYRDRQTVFIDFMYQRTDHQEPGTYWEHSTHGRTFVVWFGRLTGAVAHTVEFSRHWWWSRADGCFQPPAPDCTERYARQAAEALAEWAMICEH